MPQHHIMYQRKSRQDDPNATVEEVLAKHEAMLQEYAIRELGGPIPEENIYREVVSGESINDRIEIKKVLARIEDPQITGVLVVEPQRLSRGDLADCGQLINAFRYTNTQVCTPVMTYNLANKMERKFFQDELLRGRDYLEYTKEILFRGRVAAAKRGCYNGTYAPFGYRKIKIGKDHTLEIVEDDADVVRMIFNLYTREQLTPFAIAERLNDMNIKPPRAERWKKDTIRHIVRNEHYIGKVRFNKVKSVPMLDNGEVITKRITQEPEDVILAEGRHPAIIDMETWNKAQALVARNPRVKHTYDLKNPYSGMLVCGGCGRAMIIHPYKHAEDRYECRATREARRCYKSVKYSELNQAIIHALESVELPALRLKVKNGDGDAAKIQQRLLAKLEKQLADYHQQEDRQYELLETGRYTQELFDRRNAQLREKMEACQKQLHEARAAMPRGVDYAERVASLEAAIAKLKEPDASPQEKNRLLRAVVDKIVFKGSPPVDKSIKGWKKGENSYNISVQLRL